MSASGRAALSAVFLLAVAWMGGFSVYRGTFSVFATNELGLSPAQYGWIEALRELPGLLAFALMAAVAGLSDRLKAVVSLLAFGLGLAMHAWIGSFGSLVGATLLFSSGFHLFNPLLEAALLRVCSPSERAARLGQMNGYASLGGLAALIAVFALSALLPVRWFFVGAGAVSALAVLAARRLPEHRPVGSAVQAALPAAERVVLRREYASYYLLMLFSGARRQIVITFGALALVRLYGVSVGTMSALLAIAHLAAVLARPRMGRLIDELGEQRVLSANYALVAALFLAYPLAPAPWVAYLVFLLDNLLTGFDVAIVSHAARLAKGRQMAPTLAMGSTVNHIAGIALPATGGVIWEVFGPLTTFGVGAAVMLAAAGYSHRLHRIPAARAATAD